ncbi:hypothetical protein AB4Z09_28340 [Rhodococcus sp. TAF43]|uniref:hypothetical protein n=1 Tax=Rhodococcus sp. TAF43 TaxID=3237483 RepID=UPI003F95FC84
MMAVGVVFGVGSILVAGILLSESESVIARTTAWASAPFCLVGACGLIVMSALCPESGSDDLDAVRYRVVQDAPIRFSLNPIARGAHLAFMSGFSLGCALIVIGIGIAKAEPTGFGFSSISLLSLGALALSASFAAAWRYAGEYSIVLTADGLALSLGRGYRGHIAWNDIRDVEAAGRGRYPLTIYLRRGVQFKNTSPHWGSRLGDGLIETAPYGDGFVVLEIAGWTSASGSLPLVLAAHLDSGGESAGGGASK